MNLPGKAVVITMDDGLKSNAVYAAPILRKYGFKANVF
ncbi:polysaccharide deacetylase family protein [Sporosarcina sp. YIM B06819]